MSHSAVAHAFAHKTGRNRKGYAMFYEGDVIYSHGRHFAIARHVDTVDGAAVLFTSRDYSVSTAKHKSEVRSAVSHLRSFIVPNVLAASPAEHSQNHAAMVASAIEFVELAKRARTRAASHFDYATRIIRDANAYSSAFALGLSVVSLDTLSAVAAEAVQRAAVQRAAENEAERVRAIEAKRSTRDQLRAWIAGGFVRVRTPVPMVRVRGDMIETTWGASASLADALSVYRLAMRCRRTRTAITVDGPTVDAWGRASIDAKGNITVGCHRIPFRVAQLAACVAGIDAPPLFAYQGA